jgi:hypothetical protein
MKRYRTETRVETVKSQILDHMSCDLCGKSTRQMKRMNKDRSLTPLAASEWSQGHYDVNETEISFNKGENYPEGGFGEKLEFDICPDCFMNKLVPWMKEQGSEPRKTEWDW